MKRILLPIVAFAVVSCNNAPKEPTTPQEWAERTITEYITSNFKEGVKDYKQVSCELIDSVYTYAENDSTYKALHDKWLNSEIDFDNFEASQKRRDEAYKRMNEYKDNFVPQLESYKYKQVYSAKVYDVEMSITGIYLLSLDRKNVTASNVIDTDFLNPEKALEKAFEDLK